MLFSFINHFATRYIKYIIVNDVKPKNCKSISDVYPPNFPSKFFVAKVLAVFSETSVALCIIKDNSKIPLNNNKNKPDKTRHKFFRYNLTSCGNRFVLF